MESSTYFRKASVAAVIVDTPATEQPVFAPIGGRVENSEVEPGTVVAILTVMGAGAGFGIERFFDFLYQRL